MCFKGRARLPGRDRSAWPAPPGPPASAFRVFDAPLDVEVRAQRRVEYRARLMCLRVAVQQAALVRPLSSETAFAQDGIPTLFEAADVNAGVLHGYARRRAEDATC